MEVIDKVYQWFHKRGTGLIYPTLHGADMKTEEALMMSETEAPLSQDLIDMIASLVAKNIELRNENRELSEQINRQATEAKTQTEMIERLTIDNHFYSGKTI